jgi:hypothetical protein
MLYSASDNMEMPAATAFTPVFTLRAAGFSMFFDYLPIAAAYRICRYARGFPTIRQSWKSSSNATAGYRLPHQLPWFPLRQLSTTAERFCEADTLRSAADDGESGKGDDEQRFSPFGGKGGFAL